MQSMTHAMQVKNPELPGFVIWNRNKWEDAEKYMKSTVQRFLSNPGALTVEVLIGSIFNRLSGVNVNVKGKMTEIRRGLIQARRLEILKGSNEEEKAQVRKHLLARDVGGEEFTEEIVDKILYNKIRKLFQEARKAEVIAFAYAKLDALLKPPADIFDRIKDCHRVNMTRHAAVKVYMECADDAPLNFELVKRKFFADTYKEVLAKSSQRALAMAHFTDEYKILKRDVCTLLEKIAKYQKTFSEVMDRGFARSSILLKSNVIAGDKFLAERYIEQISAFSKKIGEYGQYQKVQEFTEYKKSLEEDIKWMTRQLPKEERNSRRKKRTEILPRPSSTSPGHIYELLQVKTGRKSPPTISSGGKHDSTTGVVPKRGRNEKTGGNAVSKIFKYGE